MRKVMDLQAGYANKFGILGRRRGYTFPKRIHSASWIEMEMKFTRPNGLRDSMLGVDSWWYDFAKSISNCYRLWESIHKQFKKKRKWKCR